MEARHTPGPWKAAPEELDRPYIRVRGTELGGRFKIANVLTPIYEGVHPRETEETRANARLIAAAPELLEALKLCESNISSLLASKHPKVFGCWLDVVRDAIHKAIEQKGE